MPGGTRIVFCVDSMPSFLVVHIIEKWVTHVEYPWRVTLDPRKEQTSHQGAWLYGSRPAGLRLYVLGSKLDNFQPLPKASTKEFLFSKHIGLG